MLLEEMLTGTRQLSESLLVLELDNGFAVGCEDVQCSGRKDTVFAAIGKLSGPHSRLVSGGGGNAHFSSDAQKRLEEYVADMPDPLLPVKSELGKTYDKILEPVKVEPVHRRSYRFALSVIGMTLTFPVSAPLVYFYYRARGVRDIDGVNIIVPVATTPLQFADAVRNLAYPPVEGVRIMNKDVFASAPENNNYVGIITYGELNPDFFGDSTSMHGRKAYLQVVFPDGLELSEDFAFYPADGNHYHEARHFLKTDKSLIDDVYYLNEKEDQIIKGWHDFRDKLKAEDVGAVIRGLRAK